MNIHVCDFVMPEEGLKD